MRLLLLLALAGAAQPFARKAEWTPRKDLDAPARQALPRTGLLFLSGGFVTQPRRLALSLPEGLLSWAAGGKPGASAFGKLARSGKLKLDKETLARAVRLAGNISASRKSFMNLPPVADYDVRLILADGPLVKDLDAHGPPVGPVAELHELLWAQVPPDPHPRE